MLRAGWIAIALGVMVGAGLLAFAFLRWTPLVPADAASAPIARTVMTGEIAPDVTDETDVTDIPISPFGQECLPRIERPTGYMDLCWEAHRAPYDADAAKDYYLLHVSGTFGAGSDGSPRWALMKGDLVGAPSDGVMEGWPSGEFDGSCRPEPVSIAAAGPGVQETLCGHIVGTDVGVGTWARAATWTCVGCLLPDDSDRSLSLYVMVGVAAGTVPEGDVYADFGS